MFWSISMRSISSWRSAGLDAWRREALAMIPEAAPLLEQVRSLDQFVPAVYVDALASPCFSGRAVLLGDAAHAMSPQLGQGANLALCDAQALAESLEQCADVPTALVSFERRRRGAWNTYARLTRWLTPVFQSNQNLLGPPRDLCFPWMCRFPPSRRMMLDSLGGMKTGILTTAPLPRESLRAC
jgi:2-polyprenyl-6-methoxyphenol hydroxylase-like FAD-dependent oxidoreductase